MRLLLDTCVISEIRKPHGAEIVKEKISRFKEHDIFISVITIGEIVKGVELLEDGKNKAQYFIWLNQLERTFRNRILPVNEKIARAWGELTASARKSGRQVGDADGLIAATAKSHGLHVATRNISNFVPTGALILNPWQID